MSWIDITDAETAADAPLTQSLLRKLRDNLDAHLHQSGQGATLLVASFEDGFAVERKLADLAFTAREILQRASRGTITTLDTFQPVSGATIEDTALAFSIAASSVPRAMWLMARYAVTTRAADAISQPLEFGIKLIPSGQPGTILKPTIRHPGKATSDDEQAVSVTVLETLSANTAYTVVPTIKNAGSANISFITDAREFFVRIIGAAS